MSLMTSKNKDGAARETRRSMKMTRDGYAWKRCYQKIPEDVFTSVFSTPMCHVWHATSDMSRTHFRRIAVVDVKLFQDKCVQKLL